MRAFLVARKSLLELMRETQLLLLVVLTPLAFLGITAFGYSGPLLVTHPLFVINLDPQSTPLIEELEAQRYAGGRPIFDTRLTADREAAETALKEHTAAALVIISADGSIVTIRGDALYMRFYRASTILESVIGRYADRVAGRPEIVQVVEQPLTSADPSTTDVSSAFRAGPQTEFDVYTPGMIMFALLMIIPQTAMLVAREIRWGTLRRLRLTRLRALDLLAGISLAQMAVAVIQVLLIFLAALALGFHNQGSLSLAIVVGLAVSFSAIGLGLIVACFVENDSQAVNVGSTVTMILVFLSGSLYQLPPLTVFAMAGHQIDLFDVSPATHGFLALQQVLSYGAGLEEITFRLGAALVLSLLYFGLGVAVFQRLQMRDKV